MYNNFHAFGRLTADPEYREVGESQVANFTIATDTGYGERKATLFTKCAAWGKQAELINGSFKKGNRILVTGEMQPKNWENKNGDTVYDVQVNVRNFNFVDPKEEGASASAGTAKKEDVPF